MSSSQAAPLRLAIIGGGVSGLSSAFYLQRQAQPGDRPLQVEIYERKSSLGGNADTVVVDQGDFVDAGGAATAFLRWADLGVNDVNLATYTEFKTVLEQIGYLDNLKPLQDTTSYFNASGALALTDDAALRDGVTDPLFSLDRADGGQLAPLIKVVHQSALNLVDQISPQYTVGQFFGDCVAKPYPMLNAAATQLHIAIDWADPALPARLGQVRDVIYYPRIAAMYFTDDRGPELLPLQSPFQYYRLQEGGVTPDRRYFEHGAQKWLEALAAYVVGGSNELVRVRIHTESEVAVQAHPGYATVQQGGREPERFDLCVMAAHADDTLALLSFGASMAQWATQVRSMLSQVNYTQGYAVCHTYAGLMPQNRNIWRTYNVLQRAPDAPSFPYRMSYVCNLHQNDPVNPEYARAGLPQFFVSLVSTLSEIPFDTMLDRVQESSRVPPHLFNALPRATQRQLNGEPLRTGYRAAADAIPHLADKAWTVFKHNVLDASCIAAQAQIYDFNQANADQLAAGQQPACALLFGGGWTVGAGLQEQCLRQSKAIAGWILPALRGALTRPQTPAANGAAAAA